MMNKIIKKAYLEMAFNDFTFWSSVSSVVLFVGSYVMYDEAPFLSIMLAGGGIFVGSLCAFRLFKLRAQYLKHINNQF